MLFSDAPGRILEWWKPSWSPYEAARVCGWLRTPCMLLLNLSIHIMGKLVAYVSDRPPLNLHQSIVCIASIFLISPLVLQLSRCSSTVGSSTSPGLWRTRT